MHLKPVRRLGQSFLTYEPAADDIVSALELRAEDEVIEIGPGKGVLTERLVRACRRVVAVEIDLRLVEYLRERFKRSSQKWPGDARSPDLSTTGPLRFDNLEIVHQDALAFDFKPFRDVKVCGNLPYNISSQILFRLLENLESWVFGVFTLQREFAQRLIGRPGTKEYGALTVLFELLTERTKLFNLKPEYFKPAPDVVSTAISIRRRPEPLTNVADRSFFTRVVKSAFAQRRKTLLNNLRAGLGLDHAALDRISEKTRISLARRAETLSVQEFAAISEALGSDVR